MVDIPSVRRLAILLAATLSIGVACAALVAAADASSGPHPHGRRHARGSVASSDANEIDRELATPCEDVQLMPEPGDLALVRAAVLCLINHRRAESGELPLRVDTALERAAEGHSQEMISSDYFAHVSPSGETPAQRIRAAGYLPDASDGYVLGENLAWGTLELATPQAIVSAWIASPEHLANILESQYRDTGIAVTPQAPAALADGLAGATYAQEFGVIIE